jgi:hypothetical protein
VQVTLQLKSCASTYVRRLSPGGNEQGGEGYNLGALGRRPGIMLRDSKSSVCLSLGSVLLLISFAAGLFSDQFDSKDDHYFLILLALTSGYMFHVPACRDLGDV